MDISKYFTIIKKGVDTWNTWRKNNPDLKPNLQGVDLNNTLLNYVDLTDVNLEKANLRNTSLVGANLSNANLDGAVLEKADLAGAFLTDTNLSNANLSNANLLAARLINTNFENANLSNCSVYGVSVWGIKLDGANQKNLIITFPNEPIITVDNLDIAQFVYLLLRSEKIRHIINTITTKIVLILGRFTPERKAVLEAIREELRKHDCIPLLFDFEKPNTRDFTETLSILAHMARFVIADITDPRSVPQELATIIPNLPSVLVQPILEKSSSEYGMFEHFKHYPWVLDIYRYSNIKELLTFLEEKIIEHAEKK